MKKIVIFGAGVGGLSVAHQLSKFPQYKIDIYEKKNVIGGLARSRRDMDGCATEYCWRVYFDFYHNIFDIMKDIPLKDDKEKNVLENLTVYQHINILDSKFSNQDKFTGLFKIFLGLTSCDKRLNDFDNLSWWQAMNTTSSSNIYREIGQWLGMDRYKGSFKSVIRVGFEMNLLPAFFSKIFGSYYNDWVTTKPTSEAWFDHWKVYLQNKGVNFHMNSELESIIVKNKKIMSSKIKGKNENIIADYYILSLPVEAVSKIIDKTPKLNNQQFKNIKKMAEYCLHTQLSFQVFFNKSISFGSNKNAFMLVDSPWDIIVLSYDKIYTTKLSKNNPKIQGGWSVAACTAYIPGILYKKPMNQCDYNEIISELWAQLTNSQGLKKMIQENNNFDFDENLIVKWSPIWPTFKNKSGRLVTSEPKFTNNIGSYNLRPSYKTDIDNLFISTAYVKEAIDIFSMEAAAIAGKLTANAISGENNIPYIRERPQIFFNMRFIDSILYQIGLPNIVPQLVIIILIIFFILIILTFVRFFKPNKN